ncbi:cell wall-binding repeat-containing protein [Peptostreptococcus anaerobius]
MDKKTNYLKKVTSLVLATTMLISIVPPRVFAQGQNTGNQTDTLSSATYYNKANWENKIKDKSRWPVGDNQRLVRVTTSEPVQMNDIDYDGNFVDANGRTVLRMIYKEKGGAATGVWYRARFNFGELDQYIDYDKSYMVGLSVAGNENGTYPLTPVNDRNEREVDLGKARGDLTNQRKNLPINLVLKEGVTIDTLGKQNYIVQMRLTDTKGKKIYAYAPKGTSMDYSTYTKTTSVSLEDKVNRLFIKGGYQKDGNNATAQEFVMSEFIANPEQYKDEKNLGIIRTQYTGQTNTIVRETVGGQPIAFTQVFDANLLNYLKADDAGNVAYVNVLENSRLKSKFSHNFGIKKKDFNKSADGKLAYLVIGTHDFQKDGVNKVEIPQHDQYSMISGFYITAIDYVVDKSKFEDTFAGKTAGIDATRKLNYSMISGWTNPNKDGWAIYERTYDDGYVANEGESFIIDTTTDPADGQIMLKIGNEDAVIRKQQGYYSYYITGNKGIETIERYADGIYKFDLREGATVKSGDKIKVYMPYAKDHDKPVNFLEIHNGTKLNEGGATLTLQKDRNINMHLYTDLARGSSFKLKYTLKGEANQKELVFSTPKIGTFWQYKDTDGVLTGIPNRSILASAGNFYINTKKLEPGKDIIVEAYDENGKEIVERKSWFKYRPLTKAQDTVKELTWTDHSDKSSILSINKSLYTPYQLLFTNDYADGTDDFYKDPRAFTGDNAKFNTDTTSFVGYTKYDGGKVRTLYEEGKTGKLYAKVEAAEDEYDDKGNLKTDNSKKITIPKDNIFDPHFDGESKEYRAYEYKVDLTKMLPYHSYDKTETKLELKKDMKFVSTASDGSSLPSDLLETRVRARVLFDTTDGEFADKTKKAVKIAPDNTKFYGEDGYAANGFEGANVKEGTGDKFPEAPTLEGKNFLGWVTEDGKKALGDKAVVTADEFNKLSKDQIFTNETPITRHLVVYAVYSEDVAVTFDANQGRFGDGKDTTNVKVEDGKVTAPTPTRDGFTFKGWSDKKDATEADADILKNVKAPKTVYAVWEKKATEALQLNDPTPVEVKNTKSLTSDEIDKVKKAVAEANKDKGITEADVTVAEDGTVTVTKDGKTGTLEPAKTVKQKEVQNNFNPPKEPVKVENKNSLTTEEKQAVKDAIKAANPDRNFTNEDITVNDDGSVKINQGGKVGTIPADKTVVQKDTILDLTPPDKTEVKDTTDLTKAERDKVAAAVKDKNSLPDTAKIEVDSKGNVTVTNGAKTGTLEGKDTVKPFTRDGKKLNPPATKVKVGDTNKLTEAEKQAVRDEIKKANPELGFTDDEIQVDPNGTVTVPMGKNEASIPAEETVEQAKDTDKTIKLVAPAKTEVADKTKLTQEEKKAVEEAVKKANTDLPQDATVTVAEDGSVTVTQGKGENQKVGQLSQADTVLEKLKAPTVEAVDDGSVKVLPNNKESDTLEISFGDPATIVTATKGADGNWALADGTDPSIKIDKETGTVTIPASKLSKKEEVKAKEKAGEQVSPEATVNSNDTTAPEKPAVKVEDNGSVTVTPPTDADTKSVTIAYKDKDGHDQTLVATKGDDGKWTLPAGTDTSIKIDEATGAVTLPKDKIKAGEKVTAKAKDANDNESAEGEATPVDKTKLQEEVDKNNDDAIKNSDKYKNADQTKKDAYDSALDKANKVLGDPNAEQKDVNDALQQLKEAEKALDGKTDTTAPQAPKVEAKDNGDVVVTPPTDADTKEVSVTYTPEGKTEPVTVTATKDPKTGKWSVPEGSDVTVDPETGVITVPADKVKDGTEVSAVAKDEAGNASTPTETSKANAKKPADTTAPQAPKVEAKDNGDVVVTPPTDANLKSVTIEYTDPQGNKKTVIATKDGNAWTFNPSEAGFTIDASGDIVIPKDQVKPGTVVSATAKNTGDKESTTGSAKVPSLADKYTPEYTEADGGVGTKSTITGPNFKDAKGQDTTKPANTTFELGQDAPTGAAVDANGTVTYTPTEADKGKTITIPVVVNYSDGSSETVNATIAVAGENINKPTAPTVVANEDGSVTVTPSNTDANTKQLEVTYTPEGATDPVTVKATKDANGWTLPSGVTDVSIDPQTGVITIQADKVADNTEVKAVAKDSTGVNTSDEAKANAKARVDKKPLEAEINDEHKTKADVKYKNASAVKKKAYDDALAEAKRIFADPNATQEEVNKAKDALTAAKKALDGTTSGGTTPTPTPKPGGTTPTPRPGETTEESPKRTTDRTKGKDRVETAIEISKKYFRHANTVIVVDRKDFPDAMTASVLSKLLKAPILLTDTNKLDPRVAAEIQRLGAKDVIIVGGNKSVSEAVKKELAKFDKDAVERIYGRDRYETSAQVARRVVGITGKLGHAVVASGEVFADALAVAPYASREGYPILLVRANNLPKSVKDAITELAINRVTIAGGYITVNKSLEASLPTVVERLSGRTRYETAIAIADKKFSGSKETFLANGEHWMDALVIGPVGGISDRPILLTPANNAPKSLKDYIAKSKIEKITAIGGTSMVSDRVLNELSK